MTLLGLDLVGYSMTGVRRTFSSCVDDLEQRGKLPSGAFMEGDLDDPGYYLAYFATEGAAPVSEQASRLGLEKKLTIGSENLSGAFAAFAAFGHPEQYLVPRREGRATVFDLYISK